MRIDLYTKSVLTVIAACLLWLCTGAFGVQAQQKGPALASGTPQPVVVVGWGTMDDDGRITIARREAGGIDPDLPVRVVGMPSAPLDVRLPSRPLDVRLPYSDGSPMPVGITRIDRAGAWEPVRTVVEGEPVRPRPGR